MTMDGEMANQGRSGKGCLLLLLVAAGALALPFFWRAWVQGEYGRRIYRAEEAPQRPVAIVFGAAVYRSGRLSPMLRDRMETAIGLYKSGKVQHLLLSGDNSSDDYNEPGAMKAYAMARGLPEEALQPDYAGRRTYDTCYRAREIFKVESVILVTQEFHLPRALFTCDRLGLDAVGVAADLRNYHPRSLAWSRSRELAALLRALVDTTVQLPPAVLGEEEPLT